MKKAIQEMYDESERKKEKKNQQLNSQREIQYSYVPQHLSKENLNSRQLNQSYHGNPQIYQPNNRNSVMNLQMNSLQMQNQQHSHRDSFDISDKYNSQLNNSKCSQDKGQRIYIKINHNGEFKRFSQFIAEADFSDLQYRMLVAFKYIQEDKLDQIQVDHDIIQDLFQNQNKKKNQQINNPDEKAADIEEYEKIEEKLKVMARKQKMYEKIQNFDIQLIFTPQNLDQSQALQKFYKENKEHMYIISSQKEYEVVIDSVIDQNNNKPQPKVKRGFFDKILGIKQSEFDNQQNSQLNRCESNQISLTALISHNLKRIESNVPQKLLGGEDGKLIIVQNQFQIDVDKSQEFENALDFESNLVINDQKQFNQNQLPNFADQNENVQVLNNEIAQLSDQQEVQEIQIDKAQQDFIGLLRKNLSGRDQDKKDQNLHLQSQVNAIEIQQIQNDVKQESYSQNIDPQIIIDIFEFIKQNGSISQSQIQDLNKQKEYQSSISQHNHNQDQFTKRSLDIIEDILKLQQNEQKIQKLSINSIESTDLVQSICINNNDQRGRTITSEQILKESQSMSDSLKKSSNKNSSKASDHPYNRQIQQNQQEESKQLSNEGDKQKSQINQGVSENSKLRQYQRMRENLKQSMSYYSIKQSSQSDNNKSINQ